MSDVWDSTDEAYMCLLDEKRTVAFRAAIQSVVRAGDRVLDVGAGTGILSLCAAAAGASVVYAIEGDRALAHALERTVVANGFEEVIRVIAGDVRDVPPIDGVDVVLAELVDTGLIAEPFVPVYNELVNSKWVSGSTQFVPSGYQTFMRPAVTAGKLYGFEIRAPKHLWPFYDGSGWTSDEVQYLGDWTEVWKAKFAGEYISSVIEADIECPAGTNGIAIQGLAELGGGISIGQLPSINAIRVILFDGGQLDESSVVRVRYVLGGGLNELSVRIARA